MEHLITATDLGKSVMTPNGQLDILTAVTISIKPADTVAVIGASGSGKSTLLALLAGLDSPSSGHVIIAGENISAMDEDQRADIRSRFVGFVFQSFHLLPGLTAQENVMLPLEVKGERSARDKALDLLQRVGLGERTGHYPSQLSGGEQQRVAIARAFVTTPQILFADEPTGNLDRHTGQTIIDLLFQLNSEFNTTLILVTHDQSLAQRCHEKIELEAGRVVNAS
ncbi:MAG: ABC transporter ATP-binding protein [Gammaproteobacteria bacterium]|nr:ABC transporter ATP-binding protein [Gammaproteobacteria bacterium]